jgi:hypothetical protein
MRSPSKAATFYAASSLVAVLLAVTPTHAAPEPAQVRVDGAVVVRDADHAARLAYQESVAVLFGEAASSVAASFALVPAGKRLVIEQVTVEAQVAVGETARCSIVTHLGDTAVAHRLVMHDQGVLADPAADARSFVASQTVRLYESAGAAPAVSVFRTLASGPAPVVATLSGYLVDVR